MLYQFPTCPYEALNAKILGEPGEHRVSQVIRVRPFQIIDRRHQSRFSACGISPSPRPSVLRPSDRDAPRAGSLTVSDLFETVELLEESRPRCRRETGAHFGDIVEGAALVIADQDRLEVLGARSVSADRELAPSVDAHSLPRASALARLVEAGAPLRDDAPRTLARAPPRSNSTSDASSFSE
jgi:hypothetical protein